VLAQRGQHPREESDPGVVEDFADAAGAGDDVLDVVEAAFFFDVGSWLGAQDVWRGQTSIETPGVDG